MPFFKCTYLPKLINLLYTFSHLNYSDKYTDKTSLLKLTIFQQQLHIQTKTTQMLVFFQQDPNSSIHFSYFSRSDADTDLDTFLRADSKSSMVVGMCISSREMLRISSGVRPSILRLMAIREASLQHHTIKVKFLSFSRHSNRGFLLHELVKTIILSVVAFIVLF